MYNKYVSFEEISVIDNYLDKDPYMLSEYKNNPIIREVCRAGLFLCSKLEELNCPENLIVRIQWTAGKLSYNKDPWEVHNDILEKYKNNTLIIENDFETPKEMQN